MRICLALLIVLASFLGVALALDDVTDTVKQKILARCRQQMGQYGASMVKACADQDLAAAKQLTQYPKNDATTEIVDRCERQMRQYGWSMVKACTDQDIEALHALAEYAKTHKDILAACARRMRSYGWAMVKACADQDVEAEKALRKF